MRHIFTTTRNSWLMQGLREALQEDGTDVRLHSVESAGELFCAAGSRLPPDSVLLPVFPDNHPVDCLRSLTFLSEWLRLRHSLLDTGATSVPCILWGRTPLIRSVPPAAGLTVIPWRISPDALRSRVIAGMASRPASRRRTYAPCRMHLTRREIAILRHTLEGRSLVWMAEETGLDTRTVWMHRRR
ncbi:helix-turn-helix transcriptional regulator, partial [Salmonella enterica subsp. enterica serovar Minnesota]|nr:helix-turn-helix transcriptional regulator [Salmonella enterica subsp. enterica serovar Minnesota]